MGRGGESHVLPKRTLSLERIKNYGRGIKDDLTVLKSIWFSKASGESHADRLESFYSPQAHACTNYI